MCVCVCVSIISSSVNGHLGCIHILVNNAFVNIGVHQDGLVHVSQLSDKFVSSPNDVVKLGQQVMVRVVEVDLKRRRISLSMRGL